MWADHTARSEEKEKRTKIPLVVFLISIMLPLIRRQVVNLLALSPFVFFCLFQFYSDLLTLPHHCLTHTHTHGLHRNHSRKKMYNFCMQFVQEKRVQLHTTHLHTNMYMQKEQRHTQVQRDTHAGGL